ncbi:MAG: choice-of-anchor Q domain-containing protein [Pirellulales bacterium]
MRNRRDTRRLRVEPLEDRRMLSVYTVSSTANSGAGTLRDAITQANSHQGADEIAFAPELAGRIIELSGSQLTISGSLVIDATSLAGGVTIDGNRSTRLFFIDQVFQSVVQLRGLTFTGGYGSGEGSIVNYGTLVVDACTFVDNNAVPIWNNGTVTVSASFFYRNAGLGEKAAAIYNQGQATITDSTFAENGSAAQAFKPPVIATSGGSGRSLTIERSTIGGDQVAGDPDGQGTSILDRAFLGTIGQFTSRVVIKNSVVFGNVYAPVQAEYSLFADVDPAFVAGSGNLLNLDPQLGPLASNGGKSPTYAVLPSSPALNGGDPAFVAALGQADQRGAPYQRQVGRLDMGAYEAQAALAATPGDFNSDGRVDAADYTTWQDNLGKTIAPFTAGDATGDGVVDQSDYTAWRGHFGFVPLGGQLVVNDLGDRDDGNISNGFLTLREAINFAKTVTWADTITFDPSLSGGVIQVGLQGPGYYQIEKKLTIDARSLPGGLTLDAGGRTIGMHINAFTVSTPNDFDVTLAGLTFANGIGGFGGGGAINSLTTGKLTIIDCQLLNSNSGVGNQAGAIYAKGNLEIVDTLIDGAIALKNPTTGGNGAAVFADGNITLVGSTIRNVGDATHKNTGVFAGVLVTGALRLIALTDSEISATTGGGVTVQGHVQMERSRIENTQGTGILAPFYNPGSTFFAGNVTLVDSTVSNNTSDFGFVFQSKRAGSGIVAGGDVTLTRSHVENNRVVNLQNVQGGGVTAWGRVTATDSFINGNYAEIGGGIYARGNDAQGSPLPGEVVVTLVGTEVDGNESSGAAALHAFGSVAIQSSSLSDNKLSNQIVSGDRKGIVFLEVGSGHTLTITDSTLARNSGVLDPLFRLNNSLSNVNTQIIRSEIVDNEMNGVLATRVVDSTIARNAGTGVFGTVVEILSSTISGNRQSGVAGTDVHIQDSTIQDNLSVGGGAGVTAGGWLVVERSLIAGNQSTFTIPGFNIGAAGGLRAPNVILVDSTVRDNTVSGPSAWGGGINAQSVQVYGSTISGNSAVGDGARGGGIFAPNLIQLRQSTISGNRVEGTTAQGGGTWGQMLEAVHVTVVDNHAIGDSTEGGGIFADTARVLLGSVVANNTAAAAPDLRATNVDPVSTSPGVAYSLVRDPNGSPLATGGGGVGNLLGVDPLLGPLADNGGPTRTHAPLALSPLIDAGDPSLVSIPFGVSTPFTPTILIPGIYDQRGEPYDRVVNGGSGTPRVDIGAVEVQPPAGGASLFKLDVPFVEPLTGAASRAPAAHAHDAALAEITADDLLLVTAAGSRRHPVSLWDASDDQAPSEAQDVAQELPLLGLPVL